MRRLAVADDWEPALAHGLDQAVVGGAVEAAVAKCDSAGVGDSFVEMHRGGISRITAGGSASSASPSLLTGPPSRAYR